MATRTKRDDEGRTEDDDERRAPAPSAAQGEHDPHAALLAGLEELVPGLKLLDRELVLEGGARIDLAALEPGGRLVLAQIASDDSDRAALDALELLSALGRDLELVTRHLGHARASEARAPRLLIVSPACDARLAARLVPLGQAGVEVVGLRTLKSAAGERAYLVRLDAAGRPVSSSGGVGAFLRNLAPRHEPLVRALLERMRRLDEELLLEGDANLLVWRLEQNVLARVERHEGGLTASVAPRHEPRALAEASDVERFVEAALARLVAVLGYVRAEPAPAEARADEPLLSAEEIQAFRE